MSKIYLIGDSHIGLGYPNSVDKWYKVHQEYFSEFLIPTLKKRIQPGDIIVHLGDLFDNRNVIPINLLNYGMDVVEELSKIAPTHIIIGNHDLWSKSASEINSIRPFRYIPNVTIYDKVTKIEYNGKKILMMPYIEKRLEQIKSIDENRDCEYLFCHSDLNGCKMHLTSVAHKNSDKIDIENFSAFKGVYSGHIHLVQSNKNFTFVGSIFQMDRNDFGDQKGIFVIDTEDNTEEFIPNNISPVFKKVRVIDEDVVEILETLKKDRVKLRRVGEILLGNIDSQEDIQVIESLLAIANKFENNNKDKSGANKILATYKSISNDLSEKIDELIKEKIIVASATKVITVEDNKDIISFKVGSSFKKKLEDFFQTKDGEAQLSVLEELLSTKKKNSLATQTV